MIKRKVFFLRNVAHQKLKGYIYIYSRELDFSKHIAKKIEIDRM